jgi:hypothetical protein
MQKIAAGLLANLGLAGATEPPDSVSEPSIVELIVALPA